MKYIFCIVLFVACEMKQQSTIVVDHVDTLLQKSISRTDTIARLIPKVDHFIHVKEQQNAKDLRAFKALKVKTIIIHDTIIIKEKTNFWGRKRTTTDSIQSIDSTEYEKNNWFFIRVCFGKRPGIIEAFSRCNLRRVPLLDIVRQSYGTKRTIGGPCLFGCIVGIRGVGIDIRGKNI